MRERYTVPADLIRRLADMAVNRQFDDPDYVKNAIGEWDRLCKLYDLSNCHDRATEDSFNEAKTEIEKEICGSISRTTEGTIMQLEMLFDDRFTTEPLEPLTREFMLVSAVRDSLNIGITGPARKTA